MPKEDITAIEGGDKYCPFGCEHKEGWALLYRKVGSEHCQQCLYFISKTETEVTCSAHVKGFGE